VPLSDRCNQYFEKNDDICDKCNQKIHPNFIGYHKCGYANCPICKNAIRNSEYWSSHPGHENDSHTPPRTSFGNRQQQGMSGSSSGKGSTYAIRFHCHPVTHVLL
jgi:hypothetical protein